MLHTGHRLKGGNPGGAEGDRNQVLPPPAVSNVANTTSNPPVSVHGISTLNQMSNGQHVTPLQWTRGATRNQTIPTRIRIGSYVTSYYVPRLAHLIPTQRRIVLIHLL